MFLTLTINCSFKVSFYHLCLSLIYWVGPKNLLIISNRILQNAKIFLGGEALVFLDCVTEQNYITQCFSLLYDLYKILSFFGLKVDWWLANTNIIFFYILFIFALLVWFSIHTHAQLRILNFQHLLYLKLKQYQQIINVWRNVLFYNEDNDDSSL